MEVHNQEEVFVVIETPPKLHNEWILPFSSHPLQHGLLSQGVLQLLVGRHVSLRDHLQREEI